MTEHDEDEGEAEQPPCFDEHLAPIVKASPRMSQRLRQNEEQSEFEQLGGLDQERQARDPHPVDVSAFFPPQGGQDEGLQDQCEHENRVGEGLEELDRDLVHSVGDQQTPQNDQEVGILTTKDRTHGLRRKPHEHPDNRQDQRGNDDKVVGDHRIQARRATPFGNETWIRDWRSQASPAFTQSFHRYSPIVRPNASQLQRKSLRAERSSRTDPRKRKRGRKQPCPRVRIMRPLR